MQRKSILFSTLLFVLSFIMASTITAQTDLFWVGGSGDWDDVGMWYKDAAGNNPAGIIPTANSVVKFTNQSSTTNNWIVTIPPGSYDVHSITVLTADNFRILFDGTTNNEVEMNVYGNLDLQPTQQLWYSSTSSFDNVWRFLGPNNHAIETGNLDLQSVEFLDENGVFNQLSNLKATEKIRMYAGTWNSNGYNVNTGRLEFHDDNPSNNPLTKVFNTAGSKILCDEWESGFTYGSLTVIGAHEISTPRFRGSPKQINGPAFEYDKIRLLEYQDIPISTSIIEHNNFECRSCIVNEIRIEDTGETKLADQFTIVKDLIVVNKESTILFNGGNGRTSEVTFSGKIITPAISDCDRRTQFSAIHTDQSTFISNLSNLSIADAIITDIATSGSASFNLENGALQGSSPGWNITVPPISLNYFWKGSGGTIQDWDDPNYWEIAPGVSNGCIPSLVDNVIIDSGSKGDIRIPNPYAAVCNDFIWSNKDGLELVMEGTNTLESSLTVTGNFDLNSSATITPIERHEIYFSSTTNNVIETRGVVLPDISFTGEFGQWKINDDLTADQFTFKSGTLTTQDNAINVEKWLSLDELPKVFNFGASHISVNGEMLLAQYTYSNVTVNPGTSLIECEELSSAVNSFYDVQLNNSTPQTLDNYAYDFNTLILNGAGQVSTQNDLTVNDLIFNADGSTLVIDNAQNFFINGGIESNTTAGNPGTLKSKTAGAQASVDKSIGNICASGPIAFQDIDAALSGILNAPEGIDDGNNTDINFDDGSSHTDLYWIGGSGAWQVRSNWSRVSGGCPDTKNPNNASALIFDNNGIFNSMETITVPTGNSCNDLFFYNYPNQIVLDIDNFLVADNLTVSNSFLSIEGVDLTVNGETKMENGSFFITELSKFTTQIFNAISGQYILDAGSNIKVVQP